MSNQLNHEMFCSQCVQRRHPRRRSLVYSVMFLGSMVACLELSASGQEGSTRQASEGSVDRSADEALIQANIKKFEDAFNARDAATIANLFLPDGQILTIAGETLEGREAIEQTFAASFQEAPDARLEVNVDGIRFIGEELAIETGSTKEFPAPDEAPEYGLYTVLHVKRDGKWWMAVARDSEGDLPTSHERLLPLAWMVGDWIDDDGSSVVHTRCRWSEDQNYLLQAITLQVVGKNIMQVSQRIGWDPQTGRVRSWIFDSEGGFGEGIWTRVDNSWVIKSTGVRNDGTPVLATSVIVPTGNDGYVWRIHDRLVGDEILPSVEVKVVRKPPAPAAANP